MKQRKFRDELALLQMFSLKPSFKLTLKNSQRFILMGTSAAWLSRSIDSTSISTSPGMHCLTGVSIPCSITFLVRTQERPSWQLQSPSWAQKRRCERKKRKQKESQLMTYTSRGTQHIVRRMKNELNEEKLLVRPFLCLALFLYLGGIGFCCLAQNYCDLGR